MSVSRAAIESLYSRMNSSRSVTGCPSTARGITSSRCKLGIERGMPAGQRLDRHAGVVIQLVVVGVRAGHFPHAHAPDFQLFLLAEDALQPQRLGQSGASWPTPAGCTRSTTSDPIGRSAIIFRTGAISSGNRQLVGTLFTDSRMSCDWSPAFLAAPLRSTLLISTPWLMSTLKNDSRSCKRFEIDAQIAALDLPLLVRARPIS